MREINKADIPRLKAQLDDIDALVRQGLMTQDEKMAMLNLIYQQYVQNSHADRQRSDRAFRITDLMSNIAATIPITEDSPPTHQRNST